MKHLKLAIYAFAASCLLFSCSSDEDVSPSVENKLDKGYYVLSEGLFNANNSTLGFYPYTSKEFISDMFGIENNRGLGDTANDAIVYGSKMYITVTGSGTVEVVNAEGAKSIKQLELKEGSVNRQPRYLVAYKSKVLVSSFDGTVAVIDTASLDIEKYIKVGRNPERMAISGNKLYVANSGGLDYPNYDNTVSIIDLISMTETEKVTVGLNPRTVFADAYGDVYVYSTGDYASVPSQLTIIEASTGKLRTTKDFSAGAFDIHGDRAYFTQYGGVVGVYNLKTEEIETANFIKDGTKLTSPYGVSVNPLTGEVFITDAKNYVSKGEVICFDKEGNKQYSIQVGINPNKVIFR